MVWTQIVANISFKRCCQSSFLGANPKALNIAPPSLNHVIWSMTMTFNLMLTLTESPACLENSVQSQFRSENFCQDGMVWWGGGYQLKIRTSLGLRWSKIQNPSSPIRRQRYLLSIPSGAASLHSMQWQIQGHTTFPLEVWIVQFGESEHEIDKRLYPTLNSS